SETGITVITAHTPREKVLNSRITAGSENSGRMKNDVTRKAATRSSNSAPNLRGPVATAPTPDSGRPRSSPGQRWWVSEPVPASDSVESHSPVHLATLPAYSHRLWQQHLAPTQRLGQRTPVSRQFPATHRYRSLRPRNDPADRRRACAARRSEEHTSELQSRFDLVCRLLLEKKKLKSL